MNSQEIAEQNEGAPSEIRPRHQLFRMKFLVDFLKRMVG